MSILAQPEILEEMKKPEDPLIVTPLLDKRQIGESSVDVRLGHEFIVLKRSSLSHIDPTRSENWDSDILRWQERVRISLFKSFVLNPGQLVLGATLEYISVPMQIAAAVEGRSSWGRLGLIIATAATVGPGFRGCITLELVNSGGIPLVVYPGMRIAQLVSSVWEPQLNMKVSTIAPPGLSSLECIRTQMSPPGAIEGCDLVMKEVPGNAIEDVSRRIPERSSWQS